MKLCGESESSKFESSLCSRKSQVYTVLTVSYPCFCELEADASLLSFNALYYMSYVMLNYVIIYYKSYQYVFCFALIADPNTLFRSNSLSSKAMEQFMKVSVALFDQEL